MTLLRLTFVILHESRDTGGAGSDAELIGETLVDSARVTPMIGLVLLGAFMPNHLLSSAGINQALSSALASLLRALCPS